jgi:hypothetical protein
VRDLLYTNSAGVQVVSRDDGEGRRVLSFFVRWRNGADLQLAEVRELGALLLLWAADDPAGDRLDLPAMAQRIAAHPGLVMVLAQLAEQPTGPRLVSPNPRV